jgi:hypothetical protein
MHRNLRTVTTAGLSALLIFGGLLTGGGKSEAAPMDKVQICHFTSSEYKEFVVIDISGNAVAKHERLHGNPINGQGLDGIYDPETGDCVPPEGPPD